MILFYDDWEKYPNAIVDTKTSNKSFIEISGLLKYMNIKNHTFMLALHNPDLQGIDPYDTNLTDEQIMMIIRECRENPWYFFREISRGPAISGSEPNRFKLNRANLALFWSFFNHVTSLLIQPRQTGKSFSTDILMDALMSVMVINTKFQLLTKDDKLRTANVQRLKAIYNEHPKYLLLKDRTDTNNTERITINALGNEYITAVPRSSEKDALNVGRGHTVAINHIDEPPFIINNHITIPAMLAGAGAARDAAKANGEPYGTIFTTTPGYLNQKSGQYVYHNLYLKAARFTEKLYDCKDQEELYTIIKNNSKNMANPTVLLEYNHRQLGFTDEWLREKIAAAISDGESYLADYLNIWVEGNDASPFGKEIIKVINDSAVHDPYHDISGSGFIIRWYVSEDVLMNDLPTRYMVCGHDASNAINSDDCTLVFLDVRTGETLGVGEYNDTNIVVFHNWISSLFLRFRNMVFIPENRSTATTLIDSLLLILPKHGIDPYTRIFNWIVDEATEYPRRVDDAMIYRPIDRRTEDSFRRYRREFGYATSSGGRTSRSNLYGENILNALKQLGNNIRDKKLINQISALKQKNGRIDHGSEGKDDLVIAWLLAYWFLTKARHKDMYGIRSNMSLSVVINNELNRDGNREKIAKQNYQIELKTTIDELIERLKEEYNGIKANLLKTQIHHLYKDIDINHLPTYNIEDILENIEMEKKKSRKISVY